MNKFSFMVFLFFNIFLIGISSCQTKEQSVKIAEIHNARTSIDWVGVYSGVIPAASAPGINVKMTLNSDGTFCFQYLYIDRDDNTSSYEGTFIWDETGNNIILDTENFPNYFRVGENTLLQLDMEGNEIIGDLAVNYVLRKE